MGIVVSIHKVLERGGPAQPLQAANFISNFGMEGDYRSRRNRGRQITLIEEESLFHIATVLKIVIPPGASRRQVVVSGISLNETVGMRLRVGPLLIQVHDLCDPCRKMERAIGPDARRAMLGIGGICGRVIEGGILRPGDAVAVLPESQTLMSFAT